MHQRTHTVYGRVISFAAAILMAAFLLSAIMADRALAAETSSSLAAGFAQDLNVQDSSVEMYRVYNPNSGEHFYTGRAGEKDYLVEVGWKYEGVGWVAPVSSDTPVYRLYSGTDHHYTTSAPERDMLKRVGWKDEGIGWYSDDEKRVALLRQFNPNVNTRGIHNNSGSHNFTTSAFERDALVKAGWRDEGVGWYGIAEGWPYDSGEPTAAELREKLNIHEDYRSAFAHGVKGADYQAYIVLHDTEEWGNGQDIINMWDAARRGVAAHFIVDRDGTVWQCVDMASIAHHAGAGDKGNDARYGTTDKSRDDVRQSSGDYGMNSYSIGIEISHVKGEEQYPEAQLEALDTLIAYIDTYYGFKSTIIDHKMWRSGNPDTSPEFADYLANYRTIRRHA